MADQPLNADIAIFRAVRSQRNILRGDSIKAQTGDLRPLVIVVPGKEVLVETKSFDTSKRDFSPWGQNGQPIVVGVKAQKDISLVETMTDVTLIQVGSDKLIVSDTAAHAAGASTGDVFAKAQAL